VIAAAETDAALMVLVFAGVLVVALLAKAALQRIGLPPLVAYLALGIGLGLLDERLGLLGAEGQRGMGARHLQTQLLEEPTSLYGRRPQGAQGRLNPHVADISDPLHHPGEVLAQGLADGVQL
jgi:hypothetical protein